MLTSGAVGEGGIPGLGAPINRLMSVRHSSCKYINTLNNVYATRKESSVIVPNYIIFIYWAKIV